MYAHLQGSGNIAATQRQWQQQTNTARTLPRPTNNAHQATQIVTTRQYESTVTKRVAEQVQQQQLQSYQKENQRLTAANQGDERVDTLRRLRRYQQQNTELRQQYDIEQQQLQKQQQTIHQQQNEALISALSNIKQQQQSEVAHRSKVCQSNAELQQLKHLLQTAEMNAIRATQLQEKQLATQADRQYNAQLEAGIERDRQLAVKLEHEYDIQRQREAKMSKSIIQQQIQQRMAEQAKAYELFLQEKQVVDAIVADIKREDAEKQAKVDKQRQELQSTISRYLQDRDAWRTAEKARLAAELAEIHQYQLVQEERANALLKQKKEKFDAHDAVLERLTAEIKAKQREEEEHQALLDELYAEELEQRSLAEVRKREEGLLKLRREMVEANELQKQAKIHLHDKQQREEQEFRAAMMQKFADDKRIEQMNVERRRREMIEYKKEVERLIEAKRVQAQMQTQADEEERKRQTQANEEELRIVEQERQRLLDEYARKLQAYLPKGVFKSEQEYERIMGRPVPKEDGMYAASIPTVAASNGPRVWIQ